MSRLPALRRLQVLWVAVVALLAGIAVVLTVADFEPGSIPAWLPTTLVLAVGAAAIITNLGIDRTFAAAAPPTDERALSAYLARQAGQLGIGEVPALLGMALTYTLGRPLAAAAGILLSMAALVQVRPSRGRLERIERVWQADGHDISALRAAERAVGSED